MLFKEKKDIMKVSPKPSYASRKNLEKLADCYGSWNMNEQEEEKIKSDLSKGWKRATERLVREVH